MKSSSSPEPHTYAGLTLGPLPPSLVAAPDAVVLDRLGARLQFERTSVRLYEALVAKLDALGSFAGGPTRRDLLVIRDEEDDHAAMLRLVIADLGGDPAEITPATGRESAEGYRVACALHDDRTSMIEALVAMQAAEALDRDAWERLAGLVDALAEPGGLVAAVRRAQKNEEDHVTRLRRWIAAATS